jgi:hypothetical protein
MRRKLTALLIFLLLVPDLSARSNRDWESVKRLKPGTPLQILLWSGEHMRGRLVSVSDAGLRLATADRVDSQSTWAQTFDRANIRRILRASELPNLPEPHQWMAIGALAGGAIGATAGAIQDSNQHTHGGWILGGLGGVLGGLLIGCMAAGLVGIGKATPALINHTKNVYEDAGPRPQAATKAPQRE